MLAQFGGGQAQLKPAMARMCQWFPEVTESLAEITGGPYIVDGEVCVLDDLSDFEALETRARRRSWYKGAKPAAYCVFDLLAD
jgi:bifunctional non-homologous end joining protein LigD